jgi:DNA polymerase IV
MAQEAGRKIERVIFHLDMDAFYASVEQLDNPSLRGRPVVVGGTSGRGVVSAASYEARKYGIRSAMPMFKARQRCPDAAFVPGRMARYRELSDRIMTILEEFTPLIEQVSIDEAYMDVSGTERVLGSPLEIARNMKETIRRLTALTCSIGIAPNKFLAKIASDMDKPDGLTLIGREDVPALVDKLPVQRVPGVGKSTLEILKGLGVSSLGDIRKLPEHLLLNRTGSFGRRLLDYSRGIDRSPVRPFLKAKSVSSENTLMQDTADMEILSRQLLIQSERVGARMRKMGVRGTTVALKLKRSDFREMTRRLTLEQATNSSEVIYRQGLKLLQKADKSFRFRLVGIGVSNLVSGKRAPVQLELFRGTSPGKNPWQEVERAMDTIRDRFGNHAISRGRSLEKEDEEKVKS